jgi:hypothetical protein
MSRKFADIHVHPSLKPYNNLCYEGRQPTLREKYPYDENWKDPAENLSGYVRKGIREIAQESQANLDACVDGQVRCVFLSLYPLERPFFDAKPSCPLIKLVLPKRKMKYLAQAVSGFPIRKIEKIMDRIRRGEGIDYFHEELLPLIDYVIGHTGETSGQENGNCFKLATDYSEFKRYTSNDDKTIAGILTVEGASSLGCYETNLLFSKRYGDLDAGEKAQLAKSFRENIQKLKNLKGDKNHTPFFITFSHHFNSLLAGHSRTLPYIMRRILNQDPGLNKPFNELGREVLGLLLEKQNGRRILIDTKHMSIQTRQEYHQLIEKKDEKGDRIPIICSHSAVNGWRTFSDAEKFGPVKKIDEKAYFSCWELNLNDEEIVDIYDSDGLVGVVLYEGRISGGKVKKRTDALKKAIAQTNGKDKEKEDAEERLRQVYIELIWSNIFHIIRLIANAKKANGGGPANGWKIISLGSDFDGVIDSLNTFENMAKLPDLAAGMVEYLQNKKNPVYYAENGKEIEFDRMELEDLFFDKNIEEIVSDIFFNNVDTFLSKYFTQTYLSSGKSS